MGMGMVAAARYGPLHDRGLIIHHVPMVWGETKRNRLQVRLPSSTLEWLADVVGDQR